MCVCVCLCVCVCVFFGEPQRPLWLAQWLPTHENVKFAETQSFQRGFKGVRRVHSQILQVPFLHFVSSFGPKAELEKHSRKVKVGEANAAPTPPFSPPFPARGALRHRLRRNLRVLLHLLQAPRQRRQLPVPRQPKAQGPSGHQERSRRGHGEAVADGKEKTNAPLSIHG